LKNAIDWLSRYKDPGARPGADALPERLFPLTFSEHGGHAMRKGPDGWWYVIGGNDSGVSLRRKKAALAEADLWREATAATDH